MNEHREMVLMEKSRGCELCRKQATLYCEADLAYLCGECDAKVHGANFLVARHTRNLLCRRCYHRSEKSVRGGSLVLPARFLCGRCSAPSNSLCIFTAESAIPGGFAGCGDGEKEEADAIDSAVSEVSIDGWSYGEEEGTGSLISQKISRGFRHETPREGTGSSNRRPSPSGVLRNAEAKAETILRKWHGDLNLGSPSTVPLAMHLMEKFLCRLGSAPVFDRQKVRISMAASLWLAATLCENSGRLPPVKKLQECSGIPCKLIVRCGSGLAKLLNCRRLEEGWAECSSPA